MKPILFNTTMVKAILENKKSVTRRIIKNKYSDADIEWFENKYGRRLVYAEHKTEPIKNDDGTTSHKLRAMEEIKAPYKVGDILYVRETWCDTDKDLNKDTDLEIGDCKYIFKVDDNGKSNPIIELDVKRWRPSIHMPKEAARIFLKIIDIRAERLQDMDYEDFFKEGIREFTKDGVVKKYDTEPQMFKWRDMPRSPKKAFNELWNSTIPKGGFINLWESNPWVWVIEFERIKV